MIAIRLWFNEPFKLIYTFEFRGKPLICKNFFSFVPIVLEYAITLGSSFHFYIFYLFFRIR